MIFTTELSVVGFFVVHSKPRVNALLELIYVRWPPSLFVNTMLPQMLPRFLNEANKTAPTHTSGMKGGVEWYLVGINAHKEILSVYGYIGYGLGIMVDIPRESWYACYVFSMSQVWNHPKCIPNHSVW